MNEDLNELLTGIRNGSREDFEALASRYEPLMKDMAASFERSGTGSRDDLLQEAQSALLKAALRFDTDKQGITFGLYAKICIKNALISQHRKVRSRKPRSDFDGFGEPAVKKKRRIPALPEGDAELVITKIEKLLSPYEKQVFREYMSGKTAGEIAVSLGKTKKSVNNAVFRIREKVKGLAPDRPPEQQS